MRKWILALSVLTLLVVSWCTKTQPSTIAFDTFSTTIKSPYLYKQSKTASQSPDINKIYTTAESGFQASIIISNSVGISGDSITFANENLKDLRENLKNKWEIIESDNIKLSCWDTDIPAVLSSIEVKQNGKIRYVSQMYFVYAQKWYIVSHITEEKSEVKWVQRGFKNIECPKN